MSIKIFFKPSFTLIEIMIVVVIVGILSGMVLTVIQPDKFMSRARDTNRIRDISIVSEALGQYYADNNAYPTYADTDTTIASRLTKLETALEGDSTHATYLRDFPTDPVGGATYSYCYLTDTNRQNYVLCAKMESQSENLNNVTKNGTGLTAKTCYVSSSDLADTDVVYCTQNPF